MKEVFRKYFIPHKGNEYIPHFFRAHVVSGFAAFLLLISALSAVYSSVILGNYNFLAEVLPPALIGLANSDRTENKLPELKSNPLLVLAAKYKADDMAAKGYFAHTSPEGLTPWFWFGKAGYLFSYAGENLAIDFSESADVNTAWMNSIGHRANILNKNFIEIGVATAKGVYQGHETTFVVQLFGTPLPVYAAPSPQFVPTPTPKTALKIVVQPKVAGEEVQATSQGAGENSLYIEVKNADAEPAQESSALPQASSENAAHKFTDKFYGILTSPIRSLSYLYVIFSAFVSLALMLMIIIEIKVQHPRHILYGLLLLILIESLIFLNLHLLSGRVLIV